MSYTGYRFIDPRALAAIDGLPLLARTVVDGFLLGRHRSRQTGAGMEFNQYRSYQPGDDLRRVDWKLFARSDRYYVREADVETSITVRFVLDATASMRHEEDGISKFDYARFLAASMGYLAHRQGDAIGLHALNDGRIHELQPRPYVDPRHLHRFLHLLEEIEAAGAWPSSEQVLPALGPAGRRSLVILLSDLHEVRDEITQALLELRAQRNEVLVFHLVGRVEKDFAYRGHVTFEDLESGRRVHVDTDAARAPVLDARRAALEAMERTLLERDVLYERVVIDQPLDEALRRMLARRNRGRHA